jgi:hypothetical protein
MGLTSNGDWDLIPGCIDLRAYLHDKKRISMPAAHLTRYVVI